MPTEEEEDIVRSLQAEEEDYVRRFPLRWRGLVWLLCLVPGCLGLAADLTAWLEQRYPETTA